MNEIDCPTWGDDGLYVKLAVSVGGGVGAETVIVCWDEAFCCGDPLSVTVRVTV